MPIPPNLISAFVRIHDEDSVIVKVRSDAELSPKEEFAYLTYLAEAIQQKALNAKKRHEAKARREQAIKGLTPKQAPHAHQPGPVERPLT